tara:strand:+ start:254 stop:2032 length:1779 start_codon:yes stop_codon:yes gene_type:complete
MADDEVQKLAGNLTDLNKVTLDAGTEFQGLVKKLIKMSDATSRAGKKWTIFSRIVSGSPIWKIQNKVRAFIDVLAQVEQSAQANAKAAKEQEQRVIDSVQAYQALEKPLANAILLQQQLATGTQLHNALRRKGNKELKEAIKGTYAYNLAILEGDKANVAYEKGLDELLKKGKQQQAQFKVAQKQAQFNKSMRTAGGRAEIESKLDERAEAMKDSSPLLTLLSKDGRKEIKDGLIASYKAIEFRKAFSGALEKTKQGIDKMAATSGNVLSALKDGDIKGLYLTIQDSITKNEKLSKLRIKYRNFMMGVASSARPVLNYAFKVMIMLMLGIVAFMVLAKFIYDSLGILEDMGVINDIMEIGSLVLDIIMSIFGMIGALLSGDIYTFLDYALGIVDNLLMIAWGLVKVLLKGLLALAIGVFYTTIDIIVRFVSGLFGGENAEFTSAVFKIAKKALFIFLAAYVIKQIAIQMLTVAAIYAMPLMIAVAVGAFIMAAVKWMADKINPFASGGVTKEGLSLVGEKGPELVTLPKGSRVHSNSDSKKMVASSGSVVNNFNITVNAKDLSDAELRRVAKQLGNDIFKNINRTSTGRGFV